MKKRDIFILIAHVAMVLAVLLLLYAADGYMTSGKELSDVKYISEVKASLNGGPEEVIELPHSFKNLPPRTELIIRAEILPASDDAVYVKSVYSPAKVYLDGKLCYEFGKPENYPDFMIDPATELHLVETHGKNEPMQLRIEYKSPISRSTMTVHEPMLGSSKELIQEKQQQLGLALSFAMIQMFAGLSLIIISIYIMLLDKKAVIFIWLGLFALATGAWAFGENNFTHIVFKNTATLYLVSFIGFFTFIVPLLHFVRKIVNFKNPGPIWFMELFMALSAAIALMLQFLGIMQCSSSMYFFHATLPLTLLVLTVLVAVEGFKNNNLNARRLLVPVGILAVSGVMELLNYKLRFTYMFASTFQLGLVIFLLAMGIIGGLFIKDSRDIKNKQKQLIFEKNLMDIQIKEQQSRSQILARHEQLLRQQRHDLRHHLDVIAELASDENTELREYLQTLIDAIPKATKTFCENRAVNAILCHYYTICRQSGIELSMHLAVPENNPDINDSNLCIIFGNLLENAVEACERMKDGKKFIKLNTSIRYETLTITMDNSFNGEVQSEGGRFRSAKRDDYGIGTSSIKSIAQKFHGDAEFRHDGKVFMSSIYVLL